MRAARPTVNHGQARFVEAARSGDWDEASAALEDMEHLDPRQLAWIEMTYEELLSKDDRKGVAVCGRVLVHHMADASELNEFAWDLLTAEGLAGKHNALGLIAARKAYELCRGQDCAIADTYARALFETGEIPGAIKLQLKAVGLANRTGAQDVAEYRRTLERCLSARR